ncbi:hypothetical protein [Spiroplasma endosymbiont of Tricholauxania praeusta]|uniref:hypothetical protein n=1 Tax=Spiroplasma endosymbiont of Tricholauxania praeusta TaxID=3066296 RepID=UPI0030D17D73
MISHLVKSIKGYGAKVYNLKTFVNLINLRLGHINQLSPIDIYCDKVFETADIKKRYYSENIWIKYKDDEIPEPEPLEDHEIEFSKDKTSRAWLKLHNLINNHWKF